MFGSIRWRLVASFALVCLLTVGAVGVLAVSLVRHSAQEQELAFLKSSAEDLARQAEGMWTSTAREGDMRELAQTAAFLSNTRVRVLDKTERVVADSGPVDETQQFVWMVGAPAPQAGLTMSAALPHDVLMMLHDQSSKAVSGTVAAGPGLMPHKVVAGVIAMRGAQESQPAQPATGAMSGEFNVAIERSDAIEGVPGNLPVTADGGAKTGLPGVSAGGIKTGLPALGAGGTKSESPGVVLGSAEINLAGAGAADAKTENPSSEADVASPSVPGTEVDSSIAGPSAGGKPQVFRRVLTPWGERFIFGDLQDDNVAASMPRVEPLPGTKADVKIELKAVEAPRSSRVVRAMIGLPVRPLGAVELSQGPDLSAEAVAATRHAFGLAAVVAAFLGVLVGLVVSRGLTVPLDQLTAATRRMGAGDLTARAPSGGPGELGEMARQFNLMAGRLEGSFADLAADRDALRHFIADASHELRTPITALKNFNTLLQTSAATDADATREFLAESATQIDRLQWITHNLLDLSRLEAGLVALDRTAVDAGELLADVAAAMRPAAEARGTALILLSPAEPLLLHADRDRMTLVLANLVDNALKFTPAGGRVVVGAERGTEGDGEVGDLGGDNGANAAVSAAAPVLLYVEDNGPGIHPESRARIFERFYRCPDAAAGEVMGSGLGLAIVHGVVQAHGGRVWVEAGTNGEGSRFVVALPGVGVRREG